jgi:hypothetical protein
MEDKTYITIILGLGLSTSIDKQELLTGRRHDAFELSARAWSCIRALIVSPLVLRWPDKLYFLEDQKSSTKERVRNDQRFMGFPAPHIDVSASEKRL